MENSPPTKPLTIPIFARLPVLSILVAVYILRGLRVNVLLALVCIYIVMLLLLLPLLPVMIIDVGLLLELAQLVAVLVLGWRLGTAGAPPDAKVDGQKDDDDAQGQDRVANDEHVGVV